MDISPEGLNSIVIYSPRRSDCSADDERINKRSWLMNVFCWFQLYPPALKSEKEKPAFAGFFWLVYGLDVLFRPILHFSLEYLQIKFVGHQLGLIPGLKGDRN